MTELEWLMSKDKATDAETIDQREREIALEMAEETFGIILETGDPTNFDPGTDERREILINYPVTFWSRIAKMLYDLLTKIQEVTPVKVLSGAQAVEFFKKVQHAKTSSKDCSCPVCQQAKQAATEDWHEKLRGGRELGN